MPRKRGPRSERTITVFLLRRAAMEISLMLRVEAGYRARPGWRNQRACAGKNYPIRLWYGNSDKGPAICRSCPARMDCLAATCQSENDLPLYDLFGYTAVSLEQRVDWQKRRRAAVVA